MSFATWAAKPGTSWRAYIVVRGLPYVWSTRGTESSATYDGSTVAVAHTLLGDDIAGLTESLEPWAGIPAPSSLSLRIRRDATWLGLLSRSLYRGDVAVLTEDAAPADTTLTVTSTTGFAASGTVYVGTETVTYTGTTATEFTGCTRGAYGSPALYHVAEWDGVDVRSYGGPYVSDHPLTATGRVVELWLGPGQEIGGTWYPAGALFGSEDRLCWSGVVESVKLASDLGGVVISATDLLSLLDREICTRLPRGTTDSGFPGYVAIDDWSRECVATIYNVSTGDGATFGYGSGPIGTDLLGFSGLRSYGELGAQLALALELDSVSVDAPDGSRVRVRISATESTYLVPSVTPRSIWAELGFEPGVKADAVQGVDGVWRYTLQAEAPPPALRLPAGARRRVYYTPADAAFVYSPSDVYTLTDESGAPVGGFARVGKEVVAASAGWVSMGGSARAYYLTIRARGQFGSQDVDRVEEDPQDVVWGLGMREIEWRRAIAYMMRAGADDSSTFGGAGWRGLGLGLPTDVVDESAFVGGERVSVWVDEPTSLRDAIERTMLVPYQAYLVVDAGELTIRDVPMGLLSETVTWAIDQSDIATEAGVEWDVPEDLICHTVRASGAGYDHGERSEGRVITAVHGQSLATWGRSEPVEIDLRFHRSFERARATAYALSDALLRWASPFLVLRVELGSRVPWLAQLGDVVTIDHTLIPQLDAAALGVTALRGWVYGVTRTFRGGQTHGSLTVLVPSADGTQVTGWAPTAVGTVVAGATITVASSSPFKAGWKVRIYRPGDESTAVSRTIHSVAAGSIVTTVACGLAAPVVVELDVWATVGTDEQGYCYLAAGYPPQIDSDGAPYHYG